MWPFSKKKVTSVELPPLLPKKEEDEITLLPEDGIPEELPQLAPKAMQLPPVEPAEEELIAETPQPMVPLRMPKAEKVERKTEAVEHFIRTDMYKDALLELNNINNDFDTMDYEITRTLELKEMRHEKIDGLQSSLEDVSKKLITVENTLFGGAQ